VLLAAMTTETVGLILIGGVVAIISLYLMIFTDVMFGKHIRSEKWDEFLHQPPKRPKK
jgi:hypothetical protein